KGAGKAVDNGGFGFVDAHGDGDTLAGGEPIGLDHDRRALSVEIGQSGGFVVEATIGGGGDIHLVAEGFGKALGAFQLAGCLAGAEAGNAGSAHIVAQPGHHLRVGADDDEINRHQSAEVGYGLMVINVDDDIFGDGAGAAIAG